MSLKNSRASDLVHLSMNVSLHYLMAPMWALLLYHLWSTAAGQLGVPGRRRAGGLPWHRLGSVLSIDHINLMCSATKTSSSIALSCSSMRMTSANTARQLSRRPSQLNLHFSATKTSSMNQLIGPYPARAQEGHQDQVGHQQPPGRQGSSLKAHFVAKRFSQLGYLISFHHRSHAGDYLRTAPTRAESWSTSAFLASENGPVRVIDSEQNRCAIQQFFQGWWRLHQVSMQPSKALPWSGRRSKQSWRLPTCNTKRPRNGASYLPSLSSETSKRHLKRQQPQSDAKSDANFAAIVQFLICHFTVVAFRGRCTILQKSSFHGSWLAIVVIWRSLWVQQLPLNDGQVQKSSFHNRCHFGTSVGRTGTLESRSFVVVVVSCVV